MGRRRKRLASALIVAVLAVGVAVPEASAAMGGAFPHFDWGGRFQASLLYGAPADDAFAALFNPAALRGCVSGQISVQQMRPFGVPFTAVGWCAGAPSGSGAAASREPGLSAPGWRWGGQAIVRQTPEGLGFDYNTYQLGLTAAGTFRLGRGALTVGITPKLLVVSLDGTGTDLDETALGFALDAGLAYTRRLDAGAGGTAAGAEWLALDVAVVDAASRVRYKSGAVEPGSTPVHRVALTLGGARWTAGVSARRQDETLAWGAGLEWRVLQVSGDADSLALREVALRAGWRGDGGLAVGVGVVLRGLALDYAYRADEVYGAHVVSTSWRF